MQLKYAEGLNRALAYAMETDPTVFVMGIGVDDHKAVFGSTSGLVDRFGPNRVFDTPIAEGGMTGVAIGAALGGLKPVHIHIRMDFLYLAMDQLFNVAAKWRYMFGGQMNVPLVIRAVIGRSWGQGAQHSQSLPSFFMHVPGIRVLAPTTPADAQGSLLAAIRDPNPVLLVEHRLLYDVSGEVPDQYTPMPLAQTFVRRQGKDVTVVANSYMVVECLKASEFLETEGIDIEIIDPVSLAPLNINPIIESIKKTGKLLIIDTSWTSCGVSAEISALIAEQAFNYLKHPILRMGNEPTVCPVSKPLEHTFYPTAPSIAAKIMEMLNRKPRGVEVLTSGSNFKGPF